MGFYAQAFGCPQDAGNDILIAGAAAKIAAQPLADFLFGRGGIFVEKLVNGHQKTRRTKAALEAEGCQKSLLNRMKRFAVLGQCRQSFHRHDRSAACLHGEEQAGADGLAVKKDCTAAAYSLLAAKMSPVESQMVAQ